MRFGRERPRRGRLGARHWTALIGAASLAALCAVAFWPVAAGSGDALFEIPPGTFKRRMAGDKTEVLPDTLRLTLGQVLLLRNLDDVPQVFGPALIMPGQSFRLPFEVASTYSFACTAHASGAMNVVVEPAPAPGWATLQWRVRRWLGRVS